MAEGGGRLLILVVDKDDDLGSKAGIKGPVIGRDANLEAAVKLAIADPEDPDANAVFSAIKLYDQLASKHRGGEVEVATVTGTPAEGVEADMMVFNQLRKVLENFPADRCIFVSDGVTDATVTPIVASQVAIAAVHRVTVRQSHSVEQSWILLGKYLRLGLTDPRYARFLVGIPGIIVAMTGVLYYFGIAQPAIIILAMGILFILWGFRIDQAISRMFSGLGSLAQMPSISQLRLFASLTAAATFLVSLYVGVAAVSEKLGQLSIQPEQARDLAYILSVIPQLVGSFLTNSIDLVAVSILAIVISNMLYYFFTKNFRFWRTIQAGVVAIWLWALLKRAGILLESGPVITPNDPATQLFLVTGIMGVITLGVTFALTRTLMRLYGRYFRRGKKE
jgi:putative membrane protein